MYAYHALTRINGIECLRDMHIRCILCQMIIFAVESLNAQSVDKWCIKWISDKKCINKSATLKLKTFNKKVISYDEFRKPAAAVVVLTLLLE